MYFCRVRAANEDHKVTFSSLFTGKEVKDAEGNFICSNPKELKQWLDSMLGKGKHLDMHTKTKGDHHGMGKRSAPGKRGIIYWSGPFGGFFELWDTTERGFKGGIKGAVDRWDDCTDCCIWEM
jgi:hypothetical protein